MKGIFQNTKASVALHHLLKEMGYSQPPTIIHIDNSTASVIVNNHIQMTCSKSWCMNFHWLRDKQC